MRRIGLLVAIALVCTSALTLTRITAQTGPTSTATPTLTGSPGSTRTSPPTWTPVTRTPTPTASVQGGATAAPTNTLAATASSTLTRTTSPAVTITPTASGTSGRTNTPTISPTRGASSTRTPTATGPVGSSTPTPQFYNTVPQGLTAEGYPVLGDPAALFTLVEFSNFSCPACAEFEQTQSRELINRYVLTRKARYVFIPTTYGTGSDASYIAASAAFCAARQNNFWAMRTALFNLQRQLGPREFSPELLRDLAATLGMDANALYTCVRSNEFRTQIDRANQFAVKNGVQYAPRLLYSFDAGKNVFYFTAFTGITSQRFEGVVPFAVIDQTLELANQAITAARGGTIGATATPTPASVALTFTPWTSPDKLLSGEIPRGWQTTNPGGLGLVSYGFTATTPRNALMIVVVAPLSTLVSPSTRLSSNPTATEVLRAALTNQKIGEITSSKIGAFEAVTTTTTGTAPDSRSGQTIQVTSIYHLAMLSPQYALVVAAQGATQDVATVTAAIDRFRATLTLDVAGAIARLSASGSRTPTRTPARTFTPTPRSGTASTPTRTGTAPASNPFASPNYVPFTSDNGLVQFVVPDSWQVQNTPQISPVAYTARAPNTSPAEFFVFAVPASELSIRNAPKNATPDQLLALLYPAEPKANIRSTTLVGYTGAVIKVTVLQQGSGTQKVSFDRELYLLDMGNQTVLAVQVTTLTSTWAQVGPIFERMRTSLKVNGAGIARVLAQSFGPSVSPTPTARPSVAPTATPVTGGQYDLAAVGNSACVGVQDPTDVKIPANAPKQFAAPEQVIDTSHRYCAILTTAKGRIVMQLYPLVAPKHVNSFIFLARQGYYDNLKWHRVVQAFVAQTGDPTGTGSGGPGYKLALETNPAVKYDRAGVVGAARATDPDSAGSQFFITYGPQASLNPGGSNGPGYTIFGQVVEGMEVVNAIAQNDALASVRIVDLGRKR